MEKNGGAWCPLSQISRAVYEWLQIDLGELHVITQLETQGRFGNGQVGTDHVTARDVTSRDFVSIIVVLNCAL